MYGLPDDFDGSFFVGRTLDEICFAAYTMYLVFDGKVTISIAGSFSYIKNRQENIEFLNIPVNKPDFLILIGKTIKEAVGERDGTLTLKFDNGHEFSCYDDSPNYECYNIKNNDNEIIV